MQLLVLVGSDQTAFLAATHLATFDRTRVVISWHVPGRARHDLNETTPAGLSGFQWSGRREASTNGQASTTGSSVGIFRLTVQRPSSRRQPEVGRQRCGDRDSLSQDGAEKSKTSMAGGHAGMTFHIAAPLSGADAVVFGAATARLLGERNDEERENAFHGMRAWVWCLGLPKRGQD